MAVNLSDWEIFRPNNTASAVLVIQNNSLVLNSKGGALHLLHRTANGSTQVAHIFSPIGYERAELTPDQRHWQIIPTFDLAVRPLNIKASFVAISDEDGTAMFEYFDSATHSKWPVAFFPRDAYTWIRYAGPGSSAFQPEFVEGSESVESAEPQADEEQISN